MSNWYMCDKLWDEVKAKLIPTKVKQEWNKLYYECETEYPKEVWIKSV